MKLQTVALVAFLLAFPAAAQELTEEPPVAGRPPEFSQVVGRFRIAASADRTEVSVEEPITLTVRIVGQGPKDYQPVRKHLRIFADDLGEQFYIEPVPDQDRVLPNDQAWEFVYRLRPRSTQVQFIPGPRLIYYSLERRAYQTTYADDIPLTVRPRSATSPLVPALNVRQAPPQLYRLASGDALLTRAEPTPYWTPWVLVMLFLGPPVVSALGYWAWRRVRPEGSQVEVRRRNRVARQAMHNLGRVQGADPLRILAILSAYLGDRLAFAAEEPTPAEVVQFLKRRGIAGKVRQSWAEFLEACDQARFGQRLGPNEGISSVQAAKLIADLEADPSLRGVPSLALRAHGVLLAVLILLTAPLVARGDPGEILRSAENSFHLGAEKKSDPTRARQLFADAARAYSQLHSEGIRNPKLYLNWGNAELLADRVPEAILAYRRGLRLAPGRAELIDNLNLARERVTYPTTVRFPLGQDDTRLSTLYFWPEWLSQNLRLLLCLATAFFYTWACWIGILWYGNRSGSVPMRALIVLALAGTCAFFWHAEESALRRDREHPLVVIADETNLRLGNGRSYPAHAALPSLNPGMEARLMTERGDWLQVQFSGGILGWVPRQAVLVDEP